MNLQFNVMHQFVLKIAFVDDIDLQIVTKNLDRNT